jgi:hypothetical protein
MVFTALDPSPLTAFGYVGGAAFVASIAGWAVGLIAARRAALEWAQHVGYFAGYVGCVTVALLWLR